MYPASSPIIKQIYKKTMRIIVSLSGIIETAMQTAITIYLLVLGILLVLMIVAFVIALIFSSRKDK